MDIDTFCGSKLFINDKIFRHLPINFTYYFKAINVISPILKNIKVGWMSEHNLLQKCDVNIENKIYYFIKLYFFYNERKYCRVCIDGYLTKKDTYKLYELILKEELYINLKLCNDLNYQYSKEYVADLVKIKKKLFEYIKNNDKSSEINVKRE